MIKKLGMLLVGVTALFMFGCSNNNPIKNIDSCDMIYVTNGNTGDLFYITKDGVDARLGSSNEDVTYSADTKEEDLFTNIKEIVDGLEFKSVDLEETMGWAYRITFMDGDKEIQSITFKGNETCDIDDKDYEITKNGEELKKLFEIFDDIEINE